MSRTADGAANQDKAEAAFCKAAEQGAQVVCLQELFATLYFCQTEDYQHFALAESIPGPTTERFGKLAKELGVVVVLPLFERRAAGVFFNSAVVLDADGDDGGHYREHAYPGRSRLHGRSSTSPRAISGSAWSIRSSGGLRC